jgi:phosphoglycerate dehydrogenase-like enzyme
LVNVLLASPLAAELVARIAALDPALIEVLAANKLGGAALHVVSREPLAADSPLWDMPNVLITPTA